MPSQPTHTFDIVIHGTESPYSVDATYQGRTGHGVFVHDALQTHWAETIGVLASTQSPPGEAFILNVGGLLFDELIQGSIRDLWVEARAGLESGQLLRVRLNLRPPGVAALPWETLADPRRRRTLAADKSLALVRTATDVEFVGRPRPIQAHWPAKILIAAAEDAENIDVAGEIERIQATLAPLIPTQIEVEILSGRFDIQTLRRRLQASQPDILHIISHGEADGLYLWAEDELLLVKASQIAATLALVDSVKLVFLNACLAGQPDANTPFASLAQRLLQTGIPAVIAMQFVVLDRAAADFAAFLYEALVDGPSPGALDVAVSLARSALYISDPDRIDYATPLLWLNSPDGWIMQWESKPPTVVAPEVRLPSQSPALSLEIEEKENWFARLPPTIGPSALRFDYAERKKQLEKVLHSLRQDWQAQQSKTPLDLRRVKERLDIFNEERRFIDNLLERLHRAER